MTPQVEARLNDLAAPVRDQSVGELLQALAAALDRGGEVEPEPVARDAAGRVTRAGPLSLPRREDLRVTEGGRTRPLRIETPEPAEFEPLCLVAEGGFTTVLGPFRWEAAELTVETRQSRPDWRALRLWFLDGFQPRFGELAPDLTGALHRLDGPRPGVAPGVLRFTADFGSAPVEALGAMIAAIGESGCLRLRIGTAD